MKKAAILALTTFALLSACSGSEDDTPEVPQAKYPYTPPPLAENPPMSSDQIDQINEEVSQDNAQ